jgi:probable HAF family extracellular repeat protein
VRKTIIIRNYHGYSTGHSSYFRPPRAEPGGAGRRRLTTKTNLKLELGVARKKRWKLPLLFALGCVCSTVSAAVEITDLGMLGGKWSDAYAINDWGQVVGLSQTASGSSHTFLYHNGQMIDLYPLNGQDSEPMGINNLGQVASGVIAKDGIYYPAVYDNRTGNITIPGSLGGVNPGGVAGAAMAINESGQVVGYSYVPSGEWHAFLYDKGVMRDIGCPPNETDVCYSYAIDINDHGQVVGGTGSGHAFLYSNGAMTQIEPSDSSAGRAYSINNQGQVVGYYYKGNVGRAFLYSEGMFTAIGPVDSPYTVAFDINERGHVVGSTWVVDNHSFCRECFEPRAFLYQNGVLTNLNTLLPSGSEWTLVYAFGINNKGEIIGQGLIHGEYHAFLLRLILPSAQPLRHRH